MDLSQEIFHKIHRYLSGNDTPAEREAFEAQMRSDADLAAEVAAQRRIRDGLKANEYKKLFKNIHAELENDGALQPAADDRDSRPVRPLVRWSYFAAAASIALAMGVLWYVNIDKAPAPVAHETPAVLSPAPRDTMTETPHAPSPDSGTKTSPKRHKKAANAPAETPADQLFAAYFKPDVDLQSPFSKEKLGLSPSAYRQWRSDTAYVHQGVRLLVQGEGGLAMQELQLAENSRYAQVKYAASWYLALSYLQQNAPDRAQEQLKKIIAESDHAYQQQAVELLGKMH